VSNNLLLPFVDGDDVLVFGLFVPFEDEGDGCFYVSFVEFGKHVVHIKGEEMECLVREFRLELCAVVCDGGHE